MDEVDGVSGNEDRGGMQTIIKQLQTTSIPIIFIANDRQASQMRTLANYCYEIKFERPSFLNVKSHILDICSREHIRITHDSLDSLIHACNRDIRHILHTLNLFYQQSSSVLTNLTKSEKALSTSPFDACMKMFSSSDLTVMDKTNLYFHDYSLVPLLIQENYLRVVPSITADRKPVGTQQRMGLISKAADSFALGDVCSKLNFTNNNRSLISYQVSIAERENRLPLSMLLSVDVFRCHPDQSSSRFADGRSIPSVAQSNSATEDEWSSADWSRDSLFTEKYLNPSRWI